MHLILIVFFHSFFLCGGGAQFVLKSYDNFENRTIDIEGQQFTLSEGSLEWPRIKQSARFAVLNSLVSLEEARSIIDFSPTNFDEDMDSVDNESTYEFYLEKSGTFEAIGSIPGKPDIDPAIMADRLPTREKLARITGPIQARILPFINQRFPECNGKCTVCHSLVRRYRENERRSHKMHFDIQALITIVVSLNSARRDFSGGLFISTGSVRHLLELQEGDAVIHQSDLLHGVEVSSGQRWSWIMWLKDTADCQSRSSEWHLEAAQTGNPLAQFLHAHRSKEESVKFGWLLRAAEGGFARAQNEVGNAFKEGLGTERNLQAAEEWFNRSAAAGEAEASYNLALLKLDAGLLDQAVPLFFEAAQRGCREAMFNVAVAFLKGAGGVAKNPLQALHWLAREGSAASLYTMAQLVEAQDWDEEVGRDREQNQGEGSPGELGEREQIVKAWGGTKGLLLRAARAGDERAIMAMAETDNSTEKQHWLRKAVQKNNVKAMHDLGLLLIAGQGTERTQAKEGFMLIERAARKGYLLSQELLRDAHAKQKRPEL